MLKPNPSALSDGMAHTGIVLVRIAFDSAVSIEIAWSGLPGSPLRSIQRPSQPVDFTPVVSPLNHMSELSKWLSEYFRTSAAGMSARFEPAPPVPLPHSVSRPPADPL